MNDHRFRLHEYLSSLEPEREPLLKELRAYAKGHHIPIVLKETESFLKTIVTIRKPKSILEIGSGIGYSTIVLAFSAPESYITTIESYKKRILLLRENLEKARIDDRIKVFESDASSILGELAAENQKYDLIFLDAAKGQYLRWLPFIINLMHGGSILFADNVLQDETVIESRFLLPHRARSTHVRMREFLFRIKHDERLVSSVVPVGDGVLVSVKV